MLYIGIRKTLDWHDEALVDARILPSFRPKYDQWNATFTVRYAAFRQRLKEIAAANLARVQGARVVPLDEVPPGAWVLPIDDDDWLAPDLVERVGPSLVHGAAGCCWVHSIVQAPRPRPQASWWRKLRRRRRARRPVEVGAEGGKGPYVCGTNNHILANTPAHAPLLLDHTEASRFAEEHPSRMPRLPLMLSVQNRNLASQTSLAWGQPTIRREDLLAAWRRHVDLYPRIRLAAGLAWAAPYVEQVADLTRSVQVRTR